MGIANSTVELARDVRSMAVADAADALAVPETLIEAYVDWGMLDALISPTGMRVTIASVGALAARRRAAGRAPAWSTVDHVLAPAHAAIAC